LALKQNVLGVFEIQDKKEWVSINTQEDLILARKRYDKFYGKN